MMWPKGKLTQVKTNELTVKIFTDLKLAQRYPQEKAQKANKNVSSGNRSIHKLY